MADKRTAPGAPEGAHRRKRVAPTIDLTATEVQVPASGETASPDNVSSPPQAAAEPTVSEPLPYEAMNAAPAEAPPSPPPPPPEEPLPSASDALPSPENVTSEQMPPPSSGNRFNTSALMAGVAGGAIVAIVAGALWYGGALPTEAPQPTTDASAQIAALQKQIQDLQNRPAPAAAPVVDTKAIDSLAQRIARMETSLASLPKSDASVAERLAAAENAMKSLGVALTALNTRSDDVAANAAQARAQAEAATKAVTDLRGSVQAVAKDASSAVAPEQINALQQRLAALEQSSKSVQRALSAGTLRNAVVSGAPYNAELAQAKSLGAGDKAVAALAPFAATGVPSAAALAQELRDLLPAMVKASGAQAPQGGFLERLQANASRLVRVTPVDAPAGNDPSAVLARVEIEAAHNDVSAALADLAKLPEAARAPAQAWIKKAEARQAALAAARDFAADSARSLSQP